MANLSIRNDPFFSSLAPDFAVDPFQSMRDMLRFDWPSLERTGMAFNPMFDVRETGDAFILQADVPGVAEKDIDVSLSSNRLTISGKRESEQEVQGDTWYRSERSWGNFSRSFTLPAEVDANRVAAELKNGVLVVQLPKTGEAKTRHVTIHAEKK